LPARTWYNYETGVTVPAEVLLGFIDQTGANPTWLLTGEGARYRNASDNRSISELSAVDLIRRGLEVLERSGSEPGVAIADTLLNQDATEFVSVNVYPLPMIGNQVLDPTLVEGHVLAYRHWLPHPKETVGALLGDDSMHPILPAGSVVAVDRTQTGAVDLHGQIVAARHEKETIVRWLEVSGSHVILRPHQQSKEFPLIPVEYNPRAQQLVIGQVVWAWSRFGSR
jgi:hypothetical protein